MDIQIIHIGQDSGNSRFKGYIEIDTALYKKLWKEINFAIDKNNVPIHKTFDLVQEKTVELVKNKLKEDLQELVPKEEMENAINEMINNPATKSDIKSFIIQFWSNVSKSKKLTDSIEKIDRLEKEIYKNEAIVSRMQNKKKKLKNKRKLAKECLDKVNAVLNNNAPVSKKYIDDLINYSNSLLRSGYSKKMIDNSPPLEILNKTLCELNIAKNEIGRIIRNNEYDNSSTDMEKFKKILDKSKNIFEFIQKKFPSGEENGQLNGKPSDKIK